ncbi:MAG: HisA/HisF-related TIM barrel protein, partial [Bacteroidota bacterium]|nr:HisA/HisF-related TIM barrel protein [Bacteroidota bacterium]
TGGSIAVKSPDVFIRWIEKYGPERIILGADVREGMIAVSGWQEETSLEVIEFIRNFCEKGISKVISTDISKDGMLCGPAFSLYKQILDAFPELGLIASGGISTMKDIFELDEMGVPGVITGKAIYENRISLKEIEKFMI